jgi:hypothetical protein
LDYLFGKLGKLRKLLWDDLMGYLREKCHGESVLAELEQFRVAGTMKKSVNMSTLEGGRL